MTRFFDQISQWWASEIDDTETSSKPDRITKIDDIDPYKVEDEIKVEPEPKISARNPDKKRNG